MKGFKNVYAYIENKGLIYTDIAIENGKITAIGNGLDITEELPYKTGEIVLPGFIDQHVHGAGGADGMDCEYSALTTIARSLATEGTTAFLGTTMTQSVENIASALSGINNYISANEKSGARMLGVHLEGPFVCEKFAGAQPTNYLQKPDVNAFDKYNKASGNNIKIVTLAPEIEGGKELTSHLKKLGVVASVGHSEAGFDTVKECEKLGLSCVTHTFNAQRGIHHRDLGVAGAGLYIDNLYTEMICDLIHLSAPTIQFIIKNKPHDKIILITDSMRAKNLPDGESELGGQKVIVKNGEARLLNGALAGSVLNMNVAIKNLVKKCEVPLTDAVDFATINPATNLGVEKTKGSIALGKDADFAVIDKNYEVKLTVREGEIVYKK